eukprot:3106768-Rhodomonas_salina.1
MEVPDQTRVSAMQAYSSRLHCSTEQRAAADSTDARAGMFAVVEGGTEGGAASASVVGAVATETNARMSNVASHLKQGLAGLESVRLPNARGNIPGGVEGNHGFAFEQQQ